MTSVIVDRLKGLSGSTAIKAPVKAVTTGAITLSGLQTIDGVPVIENDRVLVKDMGVDNGIYDVSTGAWTRSADWDGEDDVRNGTLVTVAQGTTHGGAIFQVTTADPITIGSTSVTVETYPLTVADATESTAGIMEIATAAEVTAGTAGDKAITPLRLAGILPTDLAGSALYFPRVNAGATAYELRTAAQTRGDVGAAALTGGNTFTGAQIFSDAALSRAMVLDCGAVVVDKGNSGTSTQTLDYTAGSVQKITATGNFTIASSNWPPTGNKGVIELWAVNFGAHTVTWPTINWVLPDATTTTSVSTWLAAWTARTAFLTSGINKVKLESIDAGSTIYGYWAC